jgi:hypothetical protein
MLSLLLAASVAVVAQPSPDKLYREALRYLDKSVIRDPNFIGQCKACCTNMLRKDLDDDLHVAGRFVPNNQHLPLCDLVKRKYQVTDCQAVKNGNSAIVRHVQDSLATFWEGYQMQPQGALSDVLSDLISPYKDGYVVFFSDIYKNTLAAEVKAFCVPYDKKPWTGGSISFYFVFNESGNLEEIYSGVVAAQE